MPSYYSALLWTATILFLAPSCNDLNDNFRATLSVSSTLSTDDNNNVLASLLLSATITASDNNSLTRGFSTWCPDCVPGDDDRSKRQSGNQQSCVQRFWSTWSSWSSCHVTCTQTRMRHCTYAVTSRCTFNCPGVRQETRRCRGGDCCTSSSPSTWGQWWAWSRCSDATCGPPETRERNRRCQVNECGLPCKGGTAKETKPCPELPLCEGTTTTGYQKGNGTNVTKRTETQNTKSDSLLVALWWLLGISAAMLFAGVVVVVWRRCCRKKRSAEPEIIDINLNLQSLMQNRDHAASTSVPAATVGSSVVGAREEDKSETGSVLSSSLEDSSVDTLPASEPPASTGKEEDPELSEDVAEAGDIYYHAPGFYYS